jgi:hypothetical protein
MTANEKVFIKRREDLGLVCPEPKPNWEIYIEDNNKKLN